MRMVVLIGCWSISERAISFLCKYDGFISTAFWDELVIFNIMIIDFAMI